MNLRTLRHTIVVLALGLPAAVGWGQLPSLGDGGELSLAAERRLGERIARELYRDPDYIDDPVLGEYVDATWGRLLAAARARGELASDLSERFVLRVLLGRDRSINAFALPGGWLGLHLGLIGVTQTRDELAAVLAHELVHVTQRHISRLIDQQNRQAPLLAGAMILGAIAASKSADAGNAVIAGGQALAAQSQLNFSRDMEREADRIGLAVLIEAGFEPRGVVGMFEKLQHASRLNDTGAFPYLRTHPLTTERIAEMQSRLAAGGTDARAMAGDVEHALMAARARVLSGGSVDALRAQLAAPDVAEADLARRAAAQYAAALAAVRLRQPDRAAAHVEHLLRLPLPAEAAHWARLLDAEVALARSEPTAAGLDLQSARRAEMLLAAQAQLAVGRPGAVAQRLQTWVALAPADATAWTLLARAYQAQNQTLRAVRAEAESHVARFDYAGALDRFKAAQEIARSAGGTDHIEASIVDTRTREVELRLREQALER